MASSIPAGRRIPFYVENLGCAKNQVDAESIISALEAGSHRRTDTPEEAELIIINTCGFIEEARRESIDVTLGLRKKYPDKRIILAGCFAQRSGDELARLLPEIDGVFGNRAPSRVPELLEDVYGDKRPVFMPEVGEGRGQAKAVLSFPGSAYLKVSEGCNNRCSFCAIPVIRGDLRSRSVEEVTADAGRFVESGVAEINLIAQDIGSYGRDRGANLLQLLRSILRIDGKFWLRLLYIHPDNFDPALLDLCKSDDRLLPYFDIPFQHASKRVLRKMGRTGDGESYGYLVEMIRKALPDAVIRSTFLVGFPGETRGDFERLAAFQSRVQFDWLGAFTYSREPDTLAFSERMLPGLRFRLKKPAVKRRYDRIFEAQQKISSSRLSRYVGKHYDVLVEERIEGEDLFLGRIYAQAPEVDGLTVIRAGQLQVGGFTRCRIVRANGLDLEAVPVEA